ncbi:hypothetical protein Y032_0303g1892 [Ancylostoma ceylanicum]|uniref:Uncharacterized protein n=1 Tax=Ancylostoma ceylanicum TaxID=53326 RepID=A0A016S4L1_9BILA|nr:hypothetical protein Y032_0303g1892 [Ancylostoma ceylanicum]
MSGILCSFAYWSGNCNYTMTRGVRMLQRKIACSRRSSCLSQRSLGTSERLFFSTPAFPEVLFQQAAQ